MTFLRQGQHALGESLQIVEVLWAMQVESCWCLEPVWGWRAQTTSWMGWDLGDRNVKPLFLSRLLPSCAEELWCIL